MNNEGHRKALVTLAILVVLTAIIAVLLYFSSQWGLSVDKQVDVIKPLTKEDIKQTLEQNNSQEATKKPLTPTEKQQILNNSNQTDKNSKPLSDTEIKAILQNNK